MNRKWMVFGLVSGLFVALTAASLSRAQDKDADLEKLMEKVQKHNGVITKGVRTPAGYKKAQADIEKSAQELAKIAKKLKPIKSALGKAKDTPNAGAKWEEISEHFFKSSEELAKVVAKDGSTQAEAKTAFNAVKKTCTDCHGVFRVEE